MVQEKPHPKVPSTHAGFQLFSPRFPTSSQSPVSPDSTGLGLLRRTTRWGSIRLLCPQVGNDPPQRICHPKQGDSYDISNSGHSELFPPRAAPNTRTFQAPAGPFAALPPTAGRLSGLGPASTRLQPPSPACQRLRKGCALEPQLWPQPQHQGACSLATGVNSTASAVTPTSGVLPRRAARGLSSLTALLSPCKRKVQGELQVSSDGTDTSDPILGRDTGSPSHHLDTVCPEALPLTRQLPQLP